MRRNARHAAKAPVRVGLVGAGAIANHHVGALRALPGVALEAVCDTTHDRAVRLAAVHEIARAHGSLEDMLAAGPLDVVHVLTPPPAHESPAAAALEAGADVLAEKPLCNTGEACRRLREQARRLGRTLGCSHNFLFVPA